MAVRCLLVRAGEQLCAIPLRQVRRVVRAVRITPLPGSSRELLGLAEFGGEPLPVFGLSGLIGAAHGPNPEFPVTVIALAGPHGAGEFVGLNADAALRFVELAPDAVVPAGHGIVRGETVIDDAPVSVLDLAFLGATG